MAWMAIAFEVASELAKSYLNRKEQSEANDALANKIIEGVKKELNLVKADIFKKLDDLQKEELQGLVRGYLNNFNLYKIGMPNEIDWLQRLVSDANYLNGKIYVTLKRYLSTKDYQNSRDFFALYAPVVTSYIYLLNEIRLRFKDDNSTQIFNTIKVDILPGISEFIEVLEAFINSRFSPVKQKLFPEPKPDEKFSMLLFYYEVIDENGNLISDKGKAIDVVMVEYVKDRQKYRNQIQKMREDAVSNEILKAKVEIGILAYAMNITEISDDLILEIESVLLGK